MTTRFNYLNVPDQWNQYWSKYPEGYTILEALLNWVAQVDLMVDNQNSLNVNVTNYGVRLDEFIAQFDTDLQATIKSTLTEWQNSGLLNIVINAAIQTQTDEIELKMSKNENVLSHGAIADYNMVTKTGTDNTLAFQAAIDAAKEKGCGVTVPSGLYLILGNLTIPEGVVLKSTFWNQSSVYRGSRSLYTISGACLVLRGAQFILNTASACDGFTIYYDQQNYDIQIDNAKADGYSDFINYSSTFICNEAYATGIRIEHITYLGGTIFFTALNGNVENLRLNEIYGCVTSCFVDMFQSADISRFTNIHLNPVMMAKPNWAANTFENFKTKIAYSLDIFRFRAMDDVYAENVFAYAVRNFIVVKSGAQSGMSFVNCGSDFCHRVLKLQANTNSFGIKFSNCNFISSLIKK